LRWINKNPCSAEGGEKKQGFRKIKKAKSNYSHFFSGVKKKYNKDSKEKPSPVLTELPGTGVEPAPPERD
jgi:hypothetical protein